MIAIPWYFTQQDDMSRFGLMYLLTNVIAMIWVPYSGTLTDRFSRRKILLVLMAVLGCIILSIAFTGFYFDGLSWLLVSSVFVLTFLNYNIHYPTLYAFVQEMTEPEHYGKVTSYIEIQGQLATICAGAGSALLLAGFPEGGWTVAGIQLDFLPAMEPWKIHEIFLIDGLTYFAGVLVLAVIPFKSTVMTTPDRPPILERMKEGVNYLKENKYVAIFGFASYVVFLTVLIEGFYLLAPYVDRHLEAGADVYAAGEMTYAFGAILAGFLIQWLFSKVSLVDSVLIMTIASALVWLILFFSKVIAVFILVGIVIGMCNAGVRIRRVTYLFTKVPNAVYGRVNSIFNMGNISMRIILLAMFSQAFFQTGGNVKWAFMVLFALCAAAVGVLLFYRKRMLISY
jgi:MFS family permease